MLSGAIWALIWEHFIQQINLFISVINLSFIFYPTQLEREKIKLEREILENFASKWEISHPKWKSWSLCESIFEMKDSVI